MKAINYPSEVLKLVNFQTVRKTSYLILNLSIVTFTAFKAQALEKDVYSMSLQELLQVSVTTAAKSDQSIQDAPSIISVVTAEEIENAGYSSLYQVLSHVAGFTPINRLKGDQLMVVRGIGLKDGILVLIDGVPVNDAFDGSFDFYDRPIDDIERIEIVRGPGSALYGSYAVSAVIQLFTKTSAQSDYLWRVEVGGGSFNEKRFTVNGEKTMSWLDEDLSVNASFSYFDNEGDELFIAQDSIFSPSPGRFLPPLENPTLTPTIRQSATEKFNGHFNINYGDFKTGFTHSQIIINPILSHLGIVTEIDKTIKETTQDTFKIVYQSSLNDSLDVDSKLYWVVNESKLFGQSEPPQIHGDEDQDGLNENFPSGIIENFQHKTESSGVDIAFTYSGLKDHQWLFGVAFDSTKLKNVNKVANVSRASRGPTEVFPARDMTFEFMPMGIKREFTAFYLQDLWKVHEQTQITVGARFGDYSDFGDTLDPRIGLVHHVSDSFYSKVLYGEAFKPPAFNQLFDATPTLSANRQRGNSALEPTEIETVEWQLGYDFSETLISTMTFFSNDTSNEIFFNAVPGIEQWQNSGERKSKGLEVELKGEFFGFDFANLNYSYQKVSGVEAGPGADIHPPHRLNFNGTYRVNEQLLTNIGFTYYSSPDREAGDTRSSVDAKTLVSLSLQMKDWLTAGFDGELTVNNLFDEDGRDEIEASIGLLDDVPIEGRKVQLSVSYRFE